MANKLTTRRDILVFWGIAGAVGLLPAMGKSARYQPTPRASNPTSADSHPRSPEEALQRLKVGNTRFAKGQPKHRHESLGFRKQLTSEQHPFATILGCSDSRVPIELIFDQGFGDLFVIRVAGNVVTDDVVGSIEYAGIHLKTPLVVILGHEGCGAVTAALQARKHNSSEPQGIQNLVKLIEPATRGIDPNLPMREQVHNAVESNVRLAQEKLTKLPEVQRSVLLMVGAVYELETGEVRWLT